MHIHTNTHTHAYVHARTHAHQGKKKEKAIVVHLEERVSRSVDSAEPKLGCATLAPHSGGQRSKHNIHIRDMCSTSSCLCVFLPVCLEKGGPKPIDHHFSPLCNYPSLIPLKHTRPVLQQNIKLGKLQCLCFIR